MRSRVGLALLCAQDNRAFRRVRVMEGDLRFGMRFVVVPAAIFLQIFRCGVQLLEMLPNAIDGNRLNLGRGVNCRSEVRHFRCIRIEFVNGHYLGKFSIDRLFGLVGGKLAFKHRQASEAEQFL